MNKIDFDETFHCPPAWRKFSLGTQFIVTETPTWYQLVLMRETELVSRFLAAHGKSRNSVFTIYCLSLALTVKSNRPSFALKIKIGHP